ncbi:uncharacterized protein F5147DRAFT_208103 [Suillus discolor]|uniref:F-box domain-containing protein n=1 Tax=Suillus discolor TaxID=1912936 RepID=A0A9P7EQA6_9AGAM|nr:uncharacterized protein F5147DRAFT_208103 [Suillus discolor]KAG2082843.1 hypothetical protein F5147DRAFT_208103 [Suillus discolor]
MHRALLVSEILVQIFINLNQPPISETLDWPQSPTRKSLASLALTCTTFHELAMDLLWSNIPGLRPLLGCVTRLHSVIYDPKSKYSWSQYADPLVEHEFHQFLRHSARVRNITISATNYFHLLTALPIETRVFPNLRSLSWLVQRTEIGDLRFFLPPTLRRCFVSELQLDMKYIGARCPDVQEFTVHEDTDRALLSETLRSCKRLRRLQCPPFDSAAWMHLSTIPTLLDVNIFTSRTIHYPLDNLNFATFLRLTSLSLCGIEVASAVAIIQRSKFPSLKEFEMHVRVLPWAEAEQLFRALSLCKASQTLESIKISSRNRTQEHTSDSLTAVRQFLCFKELRTLGLSVHYPIYLDDDLLFEAMTTWPHIHSLSLVNWRPSPATLTFRGLFAALRLSPQLQDLQVSVDVRNIDIEPEVESFQHTSLKNLTVDSCELEGVNVEAVARIIYSMLPAINQVMCSNGGIPRLWYNVNKHLDMLRNKTYSAPDPYITEAVLALS